ncbi:metallophosphoesterase family protein [Hutsoniella sourekii]
MSELREVFVVGDIHGMIQPLNQIIEHWQPHRQQLVFIGDYVDRGPRSRACLERVKSMADYRGAICLRGNHEQMLLNFLDYPKEHGDLYLYNGGMETLQDLLGDQLLPDPVDLVELARLVQEAYPWLRDWLDQLPYYYEFGDFVMVHAGLNLSLADWRQTSEDDCLWIREPFFEADNRTGKKIIFGHTPIQLFGKEDQPWVRDNKIGIDGGAVFGGALLALTINDKEILDSISILEDEV